MKSPNLMDKMTHWLKVTCQDTSPWISESLDHPLPFGKWWRVRMHLAICGVCRIYLKQLETIRSLARRMGAEDAPARQNMKLTDECKERLRDALRHRG